MLPQSAQAESCPHLMDKEHLHYTPTLTVEQHLLKSACTTLAVHNDDDAVSNPGLQSKGDEGHYAARSPTSQQRKLLPESTSADHSAGRSELRRIQMKMQHFFVLSSRRS